MVTAKKEGNKLIITADLNGTGFSSSGKNIVKATTSGFVAVDGEPDLKYSVNIIAKPSKR